MEWVVIFSASIMNLITAIINLMIVIDNRQRKDLRSGKRKSK